MPHAGTASRRPYFLISLLTWILLFIGSLATAQATEPDPQLRTRLLNAISNSTSFSDRFDAEVWLLDMSHRLRNRIPKTEQRLDFLRPGSQ